MQIMKIDEVKYIVVGDVKIPIGRLGDIVADVKKLTRGQQELVIRDAGVEVPTGMEDRDLLRLALSFAQNAWYTETQGEVPPSIQAGHRARLEEFVGLAADVKAKPPQVVVPREPRPPRAPKAAKVVYRYTALPGLAEADLGPQADLTRRCLIAAGQPATLNQLVELAEKDHQLKTKQPPERVLYYYLKDFMKKALVREEACPSQPTSSNN